MPSMKLKIFREKKGLTQIEAAAALEKLAAELHPSEARALPQRTYGYWEQGVLPRKFWLSIIEKFSKGKVTAVEWVDSGA